MDKQISEHSASYGYLHLEISESGCFSKFSSSLELKFSETGTAAVTVVRDELMQTFFLEQREANDFVERVFDLVRKPEKLSGYTIRGGGTYVTLSWKGLLFISDDLQGQVKFKSHELSRRELYGFRKHLKGQELKELEELLASDINSPAVEIRDEVELLTQAKSYLEKTYR